MAVTAKREKHQQFWREFARMTGEGIPSLVALKSIRGTIGDAGFVDAVGHMADLLESGSTLSGAMAPNVGIFSRSIVDMMRAGETGGVVDIVARRIADGIGDGSLPLPGVEPDGDDQVRFWRAFAWMISSGVPVLHALDNGRLEVAGEELAYALAGVHKAILEGGSIGAAMRGYPGVFASAVRQAVDYAEEIGTLDEEAFRIADALASGDFSKLPGGLEELSKASPVRQLVLASIVLGARKRASDIHFDPNPDGSSRVRLRIDGVLHDLEFPQDLDDPRPVQQQEVASRLKVMANLDTVQCREPQDGRIEVKLGGENEVKNLDLRLSLVPALHGERACVRILSRENALFRLDQMGILEDDLEKLREFAHLPHGIVLCTGPMGSGKTTLLYSMLLEVDRDHEAVMSVEDPVEYELQGVTQIQVQPQVGLTFARALRSILRQDPDVILCGEIRDTEAANVAAQCALTGHVVLAALNVDTAPGALRRLVDIGVPPFVVNASVTGVISPRLVRMLCSDCREPIEVPLHSLPPEAAEFLSARKDATFYGPEGCDACLHTGYRGRTAIHEILIPDDAVRKALSDAGDEASIRRAAIAAGMRPLLIAGLEKAARGITSVQEVLRVVPQRPL
jgi:general secretion pathway protein E